METKNFIFTRVYREYYRVPAETQEQARDILESCDDLADFLDETMAGLDDVSPKFEFHTVEEK